MKPFRLVPALALLFVMMAGPVPAQVAALADPLVLQGSVDGSTVRIDWPQGGRGIASLLRRPLGSGEGWDRIAAPSARLTITDKIRPGTAFEYQVRVASGGRDHVGYWVAGQDVPPDLSQGVALVVVDETLAAPLAEPLARFERDLTGAGWQPVRHLAPRGGGDPVADIHGATALRDWIAGEYRKAPEVPHAVILVGHLPIPMTGWVDPDGHGNHAVPSDLFYADPDGASPVGLGPAGVPQFRPSTLPKGRIAMQIGRIDMAGQDARFGTEAALLADYFDRDHRWRQGEMGDPRRAYWSSPHLRAERSALNAIVGADAVKEAGHHTAGDGQPWLLGVDFGAADVQPYLTGPPSGAVFAINFGSGKHRIDRPGNLMTAMLARQGALAVGWGARPAWLLHGMALGESIGQAHLRTVNNARDPADPAAEPDYVVTGNYGWFSPPWVNLLGDPTLRPFPLPPATGFTATAADGGTLLRWTLPEGAIGARLYRAASAEGPYAPLADGGLVTGDSYRDATPGPGWFMLRAEGVARVNAGSFHRLAQGVFAATE